MLTMIEGDLLSIRKGIIGQQVNCRGVMGAGLARSIRDVYPDVYKPYKKHCNLSQPADLMGKVQIVEVSEDLYVANLFAQEGYGRGSVQTDYAMLERALEKLKMYAEREEADVYLPYLLGCGLAGGDWNVVKNIILHVFGSSTVNCTIVQKL